MTDELEDLISRKRWVWRGSGGPSMPLRGLETGFSALDVALPQRGWPVHAVVDVTISDWGLGEARLLLPVMRHVMAQQRRVVWIAPPYLPHSAALHQHDVPLDLLTVIALEDGSALAWSAEKFLQAAACGLVVAWPGAIGSTTVRRLQLAAEKHATPAFLLRRATRPPRTSPAALCLYIQPYAADRLLITIVKARGGCRVSQIAISP